MFLSLTPAPFLSFLSGPLINSLLPRHFSHLSVCLYFWSFICCFCSSLVCISPSLHVWYIHTFFCGTGKPDHINFPFFSLSSPNSNPASCIFLCSHRDWTGVQSGGGEIFERIVRGTATKGSVLALNWKEYSESPLGNAAASALKQTHTDTHKLSGGLETVWECIRLRFPK